VTDQHGTHFECKRHVAIPVMWDTQLRLKPSRFVLFGLNGRGVGSGPVGEGGETLATEVRVSTLASSHSQDQ